MSTAKPEARNPSLARQADLYLDSHHEEFLELGGLLFKNFPPDRDKISAQVRNLEQIAVSVTRFADIEDFVKNQMGRESQNLKPWREVGQAVLDLLGTLRNVRVLRPGGTAEDDASPEDQLEFRLRLARGWARAVVSEYLYQLARGKIQEQGRKDERA